MNDKLKAHIPDMHSLSEQPERVRTHTHTHTHTRTHTHTHTRTHIHMGNMHNNSREIF